ncbi:hypothetical protein JOL79_11775 [Microbispora sp. RL4-1S]|uniref:Uncharacterized protein n=1 Tax=Microbispora oryzae TaxID=2806554 RepID=A0A940WKD4_9ACTN|nr:hypothetical protein [Microbispora oryzae]MBP2704493.1 hypothetical protein [Microbispora oryzae]
MSDIVNRLRDATRAVGETVQQPPSFEPDAAAEIHRRRAPRRAWLVPVAAAASVTIAVAAGVTFARQGHGTSRVAAAGAASAPTYYAETGPNGITIRSADTGDVTARRLPTAGETYSAVQAAQDNRLFYVMSNTKGECGSLLYRFVLDDAGAIDSWSESPLRSREDLAIRGIAVNGDGSRLAVSGYSCTKLRDHRPVVAVADTGTGETRTWTSAKAGVFRDLSMSADGRYVLFGTVPDLAEPGTPSPVTATPTVEPSPGLPEFVTAPPTPVAPMVEPTSEHSELVAPPSKPVDPVPTTVRVDPRTGAVVTPVPVRARAASTICPPPVRALAASALGTAAGDAETCAPARWSVGLLDTAAEGGSLDQARIITLDPSPELGDGAIAGTALSPDGTRVLGVFNSFPAEVTAPRTKTPASTIDVTAYDVSDGRPAEAIYRGEGTVNGDNFDIDGTGRHLLVGLFTEVGEVSDEGYRTLSRDDRAEGRIFGIAW